MPRTRTIETGRDRRELVRDAGYGKLSLGSMLAGVLVAYGAFAVLAGLAGAVAQSLDYKTDISRNDWKALGTGGGLIVAAVLLLSWLFGGYVAGRMARRAGLMNGLGAFVLGVVLLAVAAAIVRGLSSGDQISNNLRNVGLPTTASEWKDFFTVAGVASIVAMVVGAVFGGALGERWHAKLLRRAVDSDRGAERDYREGAERRHDESRNRVTKASPVAADRRHEQDRVDVRDDEGDAGEGRGERRGLFGHRRSSGAGALSVEEERDRNRR